ncbi:MAG: hypothetical protein GEV04_00355 [Actinophytocola sp.]|nr:hypothetical protein [Actinophytocola sp.]
MVPSSRRVRWLVPVVLVMVLAADRGGSEVSRPPVKALPTSGEWAGSVSVYPLPGTLTASPQTEVSFRGVSGGRHGKVSVVGEKSGKHKGRIALHRDGRGFSFVPERSFRPGEEVRVRTGLALRGAEDGDYAFTVARPFHLPDPNVPEQPPAMGPGLASKFHDFVTRPDLRPPKVTVARPAGSTAGNGHIFHTPKNRASWADQEGPVIVDEHGEAVWFRPLDGARAADFKVDRYRGEKVLLWWQGHVRHSYGEDRLVILNDRYETVARVKSRGYADIDGHEVRLTPNGTALFFVKNPVLWDVPGDGMGQRPVKDEVIQEVDVATGRVLFEWHSLGNIGVLETYAAAPGSGEPWDWLHANSIELAPDGDVVISGRHTSAVYKIDRETGRVVWRLGGKRSDFTMGPGTTFSYQHDARIRPDGSITILDNANGVPNPQGTDVSRGIVLKLDREPAATATLAREYSHPADDLSVAEANMQTLPNGNLFIGWGHVPGYTEYTQDGEVVYDVRLPDGIESYRSYRFDWHGHPTTKPAIALRPADGDRTRVYASWNGATEVTRWQVMAGPSPQQLRPIASAPKRGFETRITVSTNADHIAVRALDTNGDPLRTSPTRKRP